MSSLILPDWPLPTGIKACSTTRGGGVSLPPYDSLNLGTHVGDEAHAVTRNRERLVTAAGLPQMPVWLEQVHGTRVVTVTGKAPADLRADAVYSNVTKWLPPTPAGADCATACWSKPWRRSALHRAKLVPG